MTMMARVVYILVWLVAAASDKAHGQKNGQRFQCVQFGLGDLYNYAWNSGNFGMNTRTGRWTIGTKPMDAFWLGSLASDYSYHLSTPDVLIQGEPAYFHTITSPQDAKCPWTWADHCVADRSSIYVPPPGKKVCVLATSIVPCVDNSLVRMNMYLVKQGGRILQGWLHVEIELLDQARDEIELMYIQMRDEKFEAIGEFINADVVPGAVCNASKTYLSTPTQHEFFPCGVTGPRDAKASQGLMLAKQEFYYKRRELERQDRLHVLPIAKGAHFLWRMGEYWCNRHQRIQPFALIMTKKYREISDGGTGNLLHVRLWRKIPNFWIHPKWFGAADTIFKRGEVGLDCSEQAINDDTGELSQNAGDSWIRTSSPVLLKDDNYNPRFHNFELKPDSSGFRRMEVCQVNPFVKTNPLPSTFSGRCSTVNENMSDRKYFHQCNIDNNAPQFQGLNATKFNNYEEYLQEKNLDRLKSCNVFCNVPETQEDYDGIMSFQPLNDTEDDVKPKIIVGKSDPRTRSKYYKLRAARKYHGITFSFLAFFITPVSVFVARNFKETFMRRRCYGVHVWYWTHVGGIVATLSVGSSGHSALSQFYRVWGRAIDDSASLHRTLGYASIGSFFFLVVFGGFRIRAPGVGRIFTITLHALMGFAHHWLNLAAVIYSTWIPMSPSLKDCDQNGQPIGISVIFWLAGAWIVIDFVFHLILTILHIHRDRAIGIRRGWYFPIVPLVDNDQMVDMAGTEMRRIFLWIYIGISLCMAVTSSTFILRHKLPGHCQFGPSTCENWAGCTKIALKYAEWVKHQGGTQS